jgi:DUF971 family protein
MWKKVVYQLGQKEYFMMNNVGLNRYQWCMLRAMKTYGKLADFKIENVKEAYDPIYNAYSTDKVEVSFYDLSDNGYYDWTIVRAENGEEAIRLIKEDFPNAQDIIIWSSQEIKDSLKSFLVSYYIVTNPNPEVKPASAAGMWRKVEYLLDEKEYFMMENIYGLDRYPWCMLKAMKRYGKLADFKIEQVKKGYNQIKVEVSFYDLPDNGYYDWKTVKAKNGEEAIRLVKKEFPNAQDIIIWSSKEIKDSLKSFVVSYYIVTNPSEEVKPASAVES